MITREQVADLDPGDIVEFRASYWGEDAVLRGPLREDDGSLYVGPMRVRSEVGAPPHGRDWTITVVSRAPRPLYVNHPRTEPVPGDVVGDGDGETGRTWAAIGGRWRRTTTGVPCDRSELPARLRLLVDGETGQVVPS